MRDTGSNDRVVPVFIHGALGRVGRILLTLAGELPGFEVVGGADPRVGDSGEELAAIVSSRMPERLPPGTVVIDFSTAEAVGPLVKTLAQRPVPLVSGTTGLEESDFGRVRAYSEMAPVFYDANMSYGISVLKAMLAAAEPLIRGSADVEIVEIHHSGKRDHPSGTAYAIARVIAPGAAVVRGRGSAPNEGGPVIHVHSARVGGVPGDHRVILGSDEEVISVEHRALSRAVFARGALRAARFVARKTSGMYSMKELLEAQNE